ncbi:MAG TPA: autotransporter outer membrane beta-barrel domain-containing protein [Polyangiaceae bacterium]
MQRPQPSRVGSAPLPTLIAATWLAAWLVQAAPVLAQSPAPARAASPPATAVADTTQNRLDPQSPGVNVVDDADPLPPLSPRAKDLLTGHLMLTASVGPTWSLGRLGSDMLAGDSFGAGLGAQADAGFGVSRQVVVGAWGSLARYADGDDCDPPKANAPPSSAIKACNGESFAVGPFVRYQLSQGLRFDPWVLAGAAYRQVTLNDVNGVTGTFRGMSWMRLELGGDYYLFSGFGFGPYAGFALSSYWDRPSGAGAARVSTELNFGLRLLLDVPGR